MNCEYTEKPDLKWFKYLQVKKLYCNGQITHITIVFTAFILFFIQPPLTASNHADSFWF